MGGGKKNTSTTATRLNDIAIQSSAYGGAVTRGWGTFKTSVNLIWYNDFQAIAHTEKQKTGGKGMGGGSTTSTTFTYSAAIIMGICQGPIAGIRTLWRDQAVINGLFGYLSLATGAIGQAPWGYVTTGHPTEALGYSGLAYVYASDYALNDSATLSNHSVEVQSATRFGGLDDANPSDIIADFLPSIPQWQSGWIGSLTLYSNYVLAANLLLSPVLDSQRQAADFLTELLTATNSDVVWSDGTLKFVPYGDTAVTANGQTYTPVLTPIYDLDDSDFIPAGDGETPLLVNLKRGADASNMIQVEFLDRTRAYATAVVPGVDQASIDQFGLKKQDSATTLHSICDAGIAATVAQLLVQRSANVRATYTFTLPPIYCLLDPMDLISITYGDLSHKLVRITEIDEDGDSGELSVTAEEMLVGMAAAPSISRQIPGGHKNDFEVDPGNVTAPLIVNPPRALTGGTLEVWIGVAGGPSWGGAEVWVSYDGVTYAQQGTLYGSARYGVSTSALANGTDPDTTHSVSLDLSISGGTLDPGTHADADNLATLCLLGTEIIAYSAATLITANHYTLGSYIRRGQSGTTPALQASGSEFMRLDEAVFEIPYRDDQVGKTVHVKFVSFNVYQRGFQDISTVTDYTFVLTPSTATFTVVDWVGIANKPVAVTDLDGSGNIKATHISVPGYPGVTLSDIVGDQNSDISGLLSDMTAAQSDITTIQTAVVDLESYRPNLIANADFALSPLADGLVNTTTTPAWAKSGAAYLDAPFIYTGGVGHGTEAAYAGWMIHQSIPATGVITLSADVQLYNLANPTASVGSFYFQVSWYSDPGFATHLRDDTSPHYPTPQFFETAGTYTQRQAQAFTSAGAPSGGAYALVYVVAVNLNGANVQLAIKQPKAEYGPGPATLPAPPTAQQLQASINAGISLNRLVAYLSLNTTVGGSTASFDMISTVTGSLIRMVAQYLSLGTTVNGVATDIMTISSAFVHLTTPLIIDISGVRMAIGPGMGTDGQIFLWLGPSGYDPAFMTRTNGVMVLAMDGPYYLGHVLGRQILGLLTSNGNISTTAGPVICSSVFSPTSVPGNGAWVVSGSMVFGSFSGNATAYLELISHDHFTGANPVVLFSTYNNPLNSTMNFDLILAGDPGGAWRDIFWQITSTDGFTAQAAVGNTFHVTWSGQ